MWLSKNLAHHVRWSIQLYRKLFYREGRYTFAVVISTLASQVAMLFAFFLPLKVIILIGSPSVPDYFPAFLAQFERSQQVILLGGGAIICFFIHQLADHFSKHCAERGAERVLNRTEKLPLFSGQEEVARKAYQRLATNAAAYVFAVLTLVLYVIIYPAFFMVIAMYIAIAFCLLLVSAQVFARVRECLESQTATLVAWLSGIGFFIAFSFMAYDYLTSGTIGMVSAVISLLMSRQLFQRLSALIKESMVLENQRARINALFLHHQHFEQPSQQRGLVKALLEPGTQSSIMTKLLDQLLQDAPLEGQNADTTPTLETIRWKQTGLPDLLAFHVVLSQSYPSQSWSLRLHIFHPRHYALALNENDLLLQSDNLPCLPLHSIAHYNGYQVHAFQVNTLRQLGRSQLKEYHVWLHGRCWCQCPSEELVDRYMRTHPQLPERLQRLSTSVLTCVANTTTNQAQLARFMVSWPHILRYIKQLPSVIINRDAGTSDLIYTVGDSHKLQDYRIALWGRWVLEPIGSYYPLNEKAFSQLPALLDAASPSHSALKDVDEHNVRLAAWLHAFETRMQKQKYRSALELLPDILACMDTLDAKAHNAA